MNKKIFAANWKMYLNSNESKDFMLQINSNRDFFSEFNIMIFPSHISFEAIQVLAKDLPNIRVGMQDCDILTSGPVTGSNSITSIKADSCLVGHSERRTIFKENDDIIKKKLNNCLEHIESAVLCIGENLDEKEDKQTFEIIKKQLSILPTDLKGKELIVAYEPVWAIGSGQTPEPKDINEIHKYIKDVVQSVSTNNHEPNVLYGGSVTDKNAESFFKEEFVDGALVGGASLNGMTFANIVNIWRESTI